MYPDVKVLTRKELYDLVWSKPMQKLAEEFGMSDRGLAKLCERHRVPVPPRGYWAKVHAGHKVKQAIYREVSDPYLNRVQIAATIKSLPEETQEILRRAKAERAEKSKQRSRRDEPEPQHLFEPVEKPHRLITALTRSLRKTKPNEWGEVVFDHQAGMVFHKNSVERAISILDRVIRSLEGKRYDLTLGANGIRVASGTDDLVFTLSERTRREKHEPSEAELAEHDKQERKKERARARSDWNVIFSVGWDKPWPEFDTVYTGQLVFSIGGVWADGMRKTWADGKTQTVEKLFDQIITGIEAILAFEKARREQREDEARRRAVMQQRRELAKKRTERDDKRLMFLRELIALQNEAADLRGWLSQTDLAVANNGDSDIARMVAWSKQRLAKLEAATTPDAVSTRLENTALFPEKDDLFDPLGDPPAPRSYWDY